ncbi:MAG: outer membrane lipoprotein-sorting protein [Magnetococcus sp. WYHC-3]
MARETHSVRGWCRHGGGGSPQSRGSGRHTLPWPLWLLLSFLLIAASPAAWGDEGQALLERMDQIMFPVPDGQQPGWELYLRINHTTPSREKKDFTLYVARFSGDVALALVVAPERLKGYTLLRRGNRFWERAPGEISPRETLAGDSLLGGGANNDDLLPADYARMYQGRITATRDKHTELELTPREPGLPYRRVQLTLDKSTTLPVSMRYFSAKDFLMRQVDYEVVGTLDSGVRPLTRVLVNGNNPGYQTRLTLGTLRPRVLPEDLFQPDAMHRAGQLLRE